MPAPKPAVSVESFTTFGDLLKHARRRARLTQRDLGLAVGYSEAQISRFEQNHWLPDAATLTALFIPALDLDQQPDLAEKLLALAGAARADRALGQVVVTRTVRQEARE